MWYASRVSVGTSFVAFSFRFVPNIPNIYICDVIVTSRHFIIDTSSTQSVKLMTGYKRAKFHRRSF